MKTRKILSLALALVMVLALTAPALAAGSAAPTQYAATVNGSTVTFSAYEVDGQVYLRLRDVAKALNTFDVQWVNDAIAITTGAAYASPVGTEMNAPFSGSQTYGQSPDTVTVNGAAVDLKGILLTDADANGYTYFTPQALEATLGVSLPAAPAVAAPWAAAYAEKVQELSQDDPDLAYALIYVDEDDVPELVADRTGFYLSLYTYKGGDVKTLLDGVGYGMAGNEGYTYVPYKNAIYGQYWSDNVSYEACMKIGQNGELVAEHSTASADDVMNQGTATDQTENPLVEGNLTAEQVLTALRASSNS